MPEVAMEQEQGWIENLLGVLGPSEAEAAPFGKISKAFVKTVRGATREVSTAAEALKSKPLWGKTVKSVTKGQGDWRYLTFTDGTERAVTKDVIHELVQEVGTAGKMVELVGQRGKSKLMQAVKSLEFHKQRQATFTTKAIQKEWLTVRQAHAKQMGLESVPYTYVESEKIFLPTEYATLLDKAGMVKIGKK